MRMPILKSYRWRTALHLIVGAFFIPFHSALAVVDQDGNGMSDLWQIAFNLPATSGNSQDDDGDGISNLLESIMGTDPLHGPALVPTVTHIPASYINGSGGLPEILTPDTALITWPSVVGKQYAVEFSPDLTIDSWNPIGDPLIGDGGMIGKAVTLTQEDGTVPGKLFFRLRIQDIDLDGDQLTATEEAILHTSDFTPWSDSDYLSDYHEVAIFNTDPTNSSTAGDGIPDHQSVTLPPPGTGNTYEPLYEWASITRNISYSYSETASSPPGNPTGDISTTGSWNDGLGGTSSISSRIPIADLTGRLNTAVPFPLQNERPARAGWASFIRGSFDIKEHNESASFSEAQIRFHVGPSSLPPAEGIRKRVMAVCYSNPTSTQPPQLIGISSHELSLSTNDFTSAPIVIGQDSPYMRRELRIPEFMSGGSDELGWDSTGPVPWCAVPAGGTINGIIAISGGDMQADALDLLEIAPAEGSEELVSIPSQTLMSGGGVFKLQGTSPTDEVGAKVVLRLKSNHSTIFASLRVRVLPRRDVPVSIFRIWDSRPGYAASAVIGGLTDTEIITALNNAFEKQANIHFTRDPSSQTIDLSTLSTKYYFTPTEPAPGGKFISDNGISPNFDDYVVHELTKSKHGVTNDKRVTIHIVAHLEPSHAGGSTITGKSDSFINVSVAGRTYAHEVGHQLNISTKNVDGHHHDLGPWPAGYASSKYFGLMYDTADAIKKTDWIRHEDWFKSNDTAKDLK